jgi:hypothetical protein
VVPISLEQIQKPVFFLFNLESFFNPLFSIYFSKGPIINQAIIRTDRFTMTVKLFQGQSFDEYIEINHYIKQIPGNTEMITRYGINSNSKKPFKLYSFDGFRFEHVELKNVGIPAKYFPSVGGGLIRYQDSQLIVLTDHTMGMTGIDNQIEFMIHRRLSQDDGRGMSQANDDTSELSFRTLLKYDSFSEDDSHGVDMIPVLKRSFILNNPLSLYIAEMGAINFKKKSFDPIYNINNNLQILTLQNYDYSSDDIILRIQNLSPDKPIEFNMNTLFTPSLFRIHSIREKSLNTIYDIPHGRTIHHYRKKWQEGELKIFDYSTKIAKTQIDNQNAEEEGVFISQAALNEEKTAGKKKLLSITERRKYYLNPKSIGTYIIVMEKKGENYDLFDIKKNNHGGPKYKPTKNDKPENQIPNNEKPNIPNEGDKPKPPVENDEEEEIKLQHQTPTQGIDINPSGSNNKNLNFLYLIYVPFIFVGCSLCFLIYLFFRKNKFFSTSRPVHND